MRRTLSWDRGIEMTRHEEFTAGTGVPVYFCNAGGPPTAGAHSLAALAVARAARTP
jgi:IS30 family transposase